MSIYLSRRGWDCLSPKRAKGREGRALVARGNRGG